MVSDAGGVRIGRRIQVIGNSCSGKSTVGRQLATLMEIPLVELDALNWEPGWYGLNEHDPDRLTARISESTAGDAWLVAGSYESFCKRIFWPRVETIIWLDLPMHLLILRLVKRSWNRWRTKELLWGTNYENFWQQLMFWKKEDSLLWWIVTQHERKRAQMRANIDDPKWSHIDFVRLKSVREIDRLLGVQPGSKFQPN